MLKKTNQTLFLILLIQLLSNQVRTQISCDILIGGGTLASLGAVLQAPTSIKVCLVEPTDRLGGQLGDEGVWHIDFNWLYQKGYPDNTTAYNPKNLHSFFQKITSSCNTGDCWVSRNCFLYTCIEPFIRNQLQSKIQSGNLLIFKHSVIKRVQKFGSTIKAVSIISRENLKEDCRTVDLRVTDWYTEKESEYYSKTVTRLVVNKLVIDATQYGDILVLSKADYEQGTPHSSTCGQSIVFGIHQQYPLSNLFTHHFQKQKQQSQKKSQMQDDDFSLGSYTAQQVWRYRRLMGSGVSIKPGEVSLQNWNGPGNDYRDGYIFKQVNEEDLLDWKGGLNYTTLKQAQARALRFHEWFKNMAKLPLVATGKYFGTCNGLSKLPYIRDGRRSLGYKDFMIRSGDVTGAFVPNQKLTATQFADRVSLGFYNMDVHSIKNCIYDPYPQNQPLPFFIPVRAFTNKKIQNLIVSGRAMAQDFYASTATRTHTTEFSVGVASILMATYMTSYNINSTWKMIDCDECITELQQIIRGVMPLQWSISGKKYPEII